MKVEIKTTEHSDLTFPRYLLGDRTGDIYLAVSESECYRIAIGPMSDTKLGLVSGQLYNLHLRYYFEGL